ncbi:hypothetical protein JRI60_13030 [Archangium violaceum]|uniref:hypothetical protein n=1 Tax=Archangium violaceum TaxID=83451 RepID=UPI00194F5326|nr:hypothetical protein [Archangium violaceum]QRN99879.1 hypothetical protein JRI60_13030 [Archangium violaceum]
MKRILLTGWLWLLAVGCKEEKPAEPLSSLVPAPLPRVGAQTQGEKTREALFEVTPAEVHGEPVPDKALRVELAGEVVRLGAERFTPSRPEEQARLRERVKEQVVLVVPDADTFLAQTSELFATLRDSAREVWLLHPEAPVAYGLVLRDEQGFQAWLAEVAPGKLRIIQRQDGFELTTSVGKLPGPDANGPSVPVRGGKQDIATLRKGLGKLKGRFTTSEDICLVPSFGTEVAQAARALSGVYAAPGEPFFETLCFVYPTPRAPVAGAPAGQ